jgi:hypothetical protein
MPPLCGSDEVQRRYNQSATTPNLRMLAKFLRR